MPTKQDVWLSATGVQYGDNRLHSHIRLGSLGKGVAKGKRTDVDFGEVPIDLISFRKADVAAEAVDDLKEQAFKLKAESVVEGFEFVKLPEESDVLVKARSVEASLLARKYLSFRSKLKDLKILGHPLQVQLESNFPFPFRGRPVNGGTATLVKKIRWEESDQDSLALSSDLIGEIEGNSINVLRDRQLVAEIKIGVIQDLRPRRNGDQGSGSRSASASANNGLEQAGLTMLTIRTYINPATGRLVPLSGDPQRGEGSATTTAVGDVKSDGGEPDSDLP